MAVNVKVGKDMLNFSQMAAIDTIWLQPLSTNCTLGRRLSLVHALKQADESLKLERVAMLLNRGAKAVAPFGS